MIVASFCELYVAGCLEVEYRCEPGRRRRRYKVIDGLDLSLLSHAERVVAQRLSSFKSFTALLEETGAALPQARQELMEQCAGIVDDALAYCPPVTSCSV